MVKEKHAGGRKPMLIEDNKTALQIMLVVSENELTNNEIAKSLGVDHSATRDLVKKMSDEKALITSKKGKIIRYSLNFKWVKKQIFDFYRDRFLESIEILTPEMKKLTNEVNSLKNNKVFDVLVTSYIESSQRKYSKNKNLYDTNPNGWFLQFPLFFELISKNIEFDIVEKEALETFLTPEFHDLLETNIIIQKNAENMNLTTKRKGKKLIIS